MALTDSDRGWVFTSNVTVLSCHSQLQRLACRSILSLCIVNGWAFANGDREKQRICPVNEVSFVPIRLRIQIGSSPEDSYLLKYGPRS
jgi:hypothetical protein